MSEWLPATCAGSTQIGGAEAGVGSGLRAGAGAEVEEARVEAGVSV